MPQRRRSRLAVALASVLVAAVASFALPAAGQTRPPVVISGVEPPCAPVGRQVTVTVTGTDYALAAGRVTITGPDGKIPPGATTTYVAGRVGSWFARLTFVPPVAGYYGIVAADAFSQSTASFNAPCRDPRAELDPPCFTPGQATRLVVSGFDFRPGSNGYVDYRWNGDGSEQSRIRIPIDANGNFATNGTAGLNTAFQVTPPREDVRIRLNDLDDNVIEVIWSPCPPPTVTTSTTVPTTTTTSTTARQPVTTTTRGVTTTTTTTTSTTTTTAPPPPATLVVMPALGPAGFVATASGTGFPPGPVLLEWSPGIGRTSAVAGADGTFSVPVLVLPKDRLGPRSLIAAGGTASASAPFLVVPSTVEPSGASGAVQVNRIRRFTQR